jgi:hypothetical protein
LIVPTERMIYLLALAVMRFPDLETNCTPDAVISSWLSEVTFSTSASVMTRKFGREDMSAEYKADPA